MQEPKKIKVTFAPGAFDNFEGTQEELDKFITEITELCQDPEKLTEMSVPLDLEEFTEDEENLLHQFLSHTPASKRILQ